MVGGYSFPSCLTEWTAVGNQLTGLRHGCPMGGSCESLWVHVEETPSRHRRHVGGAVTMWRSLWHQFKGNRGSFTVNLISNEAMLPHLPFRWCHTNIFHLFKTFYSHDVPWPKKLFIMMWLIRKPFLKPSQNIHFFLIIVELYGIVLMKDSSILTVLHFLV